MRKIVGLLFVFYFLVQINNLSYGQEDKDNWSFIVKSKSYIFFLDLTTIDCDEEGILVWEKEICLSRCRDEHGIINYKITKYRYYRDQARYLRLKTDVYYDDDSFRIGLYDDDAGNIIYTLPDTVSDYIRNYLIKNYCN